MHIVLFEPEIPPNTGNAARLSAAFGLPLHLIEPLGFSLEDKYLRRAGLDYWPSVRLFLWPDFAAYLREGRDGHRLVMTSCKTGSPIQRFAFSRADALVFGPESRGLPAEVLRHAGVCLRIPICDAVRSINLSSAVAIAAYQAMLGSGMLDELPQRPKEH
ncbi:MAG: tRNA (cytidine(34)-2'-O)-methyltransferase [Deltaproteobacteria bacterium]|nr:tRNA (cytidine(34)-2'-O)-methyltransferase [Deltaproteobacteria bacterium]